MNSYPELPIYDSACVAWDKAAMKKRAKSGEKTMVRRAKPVVVNTKGNTVSMRLEIFFETAPRELQDLAGYCGARVVRHEWGMALAPNPATITNHERLWLPDGYVLVAEVDIVRNTKPLTPTDLEMVAHGIDQYKSDAYRNNRPFCRDFYSDHPGINVVLGDIHGYPNSKVLIDIEPRLTIPMDA